ncbi:MAG: alpha/beta hydrolase [Anaerolineales bacterium]|nr:alpha/beta hydrolase [Anaerolineales bacterium]
MSEKALEHNQESFIQIENRQLRVHQYGNKGQAVVLLHGGGTDSGLLSWKETIPALAETHRVIVPDWPGYGESELMEDVFSLDRMGELILALLDAMDLSSAALVGVSMGGGAALNFALRWPDRVNSLVLVDSYGLQERVPLQMLSWLMVRVPFLIRWTWVWMRRSRWITRWALAGIFHQKDAVSPELVEEVYRAVQNRNAARAFYAFQRFEVLPDRLRSCYQEQLYGIDVRTLLIHGEKDTLVPLEWAREAAGRIPHAELAVMPQCGHWPQRENPELFNNILAAFLEIRPSE